MVGCRCSSVDVAKQGVPVAITFFITISLQFPKTEQVESDNHKVALLAIADKR